MHRLVIALTSLLTLVGAGVVGLHLYLAGRVADPAASFVPADAQVYLSVHLEPSPAQRANLAALLGRLPGFADQAALEAKIEQIATNLLGQVGIDYVADVEPWLGGQAAIGLTRLGPDGAEADGVVVFAVKDREAAEAALARLTAGGGGEPREEDHAGTTLHLDEGGAGYAFVGEEREMLVFGTGEEELRSAVDAGSGRAESLADDAGFRTTMASLPLDNLASVYVDVAAVATAAGAAEDVRGLSGFAAAIIAEERGVRIAGRLPIERGELDAAAAAVLDETEREPTLAGWMPADTKLELITFGIADAIEAAGAGESEAGSLVAQLRAGLAFGLGLDLDEDILPLLDGEIGLALTDLDVAAGAAPVGQLYVKPADPSVIEPSLERIADALADRGATTTTAEPGGATVTTVELPQVGAAASYAVVDGVVVLALAPEQVSSALQARAAGETLGETERYASAFALLGRHVGPELFLDLQGLLGVAGELGVDPGQLETLPDDARAILERVEAFALTTPAGAEAIEIDAVLTVR